MNTRIVLSSCAAAILMTGTAELASPVTLVGCVQPQAAYLQSRKPTSPPATRGSNLSNAFVLIETRRDVDTSAAVSDTGDVPKAVGTSGSTSAYRLSGRTADLRRLSGKNVEMVGTMTRGVFTVISVREVPGICDAP